LLDTVAHGPPINPRRIEDAEQVLVPQAVESSHFRPETANCSILKWTFSDIYDNQIDEIGEGFRRHGVGEVEPVHVGFLDPGDQFCRDPLPVSRPPLVRLPGEGSLLEEAVLRELVCRIPC